MPACVFFKSKIDGAVYGPGERNRPLAELDDIIRKKLGHDPDPHKWLANWGSEGSIMGMIAFNCTKEQIDEAIADHPLTVEIWNFLLEHYIPLNNWGPKSHWRDKRNDVVQVEFPDADYGVDDQEYIRSAETVDDLKSIVETIHFSAGLDNALPSMIVTTGDGRRHKVVLAVQLVEIEEATK